MFYNIELSVPSEQAHNHKSKSWVIFFWSILLYGPSKSLQWWEMCDSLMWCKTLLAYCLNNILCRNGAGIASVYIYIWLTLYCYVCKQLKYIKPNHQPLINDQPVPFIIPTSPANLCLWWQMTTLTGIARYLPRIPRLLLPKGIGSS